MSLLEIGVAYFLAVGAAVFIAIGLFMAARRGDDKASHAMRERERREALNRISGGPGSGWRGR